MGAAGVVQGLSRPLRRLTRAVAPRPGSGNEGAPPTHSRVLGCKPARCLGSHGESVPAVISAELGQELARQILAFEPDGHSPYSR